MPIKLCRRAIAIRDGHMPKVDGDRATATNTVGHDKVVMVRKLNKHVARCKECG